MAVTGSLRKVVIDGVPFLPAFDTNVTLNLSPIEKEGIATPGRTMFKHTIRSPNAEGVVLVAEPSEQDLLRQTSERLDTYPLTIELANGDIWRTTGQIGFENAETEESRASVMFIPDRSVGAWELFVAGGA